MKKEIEEIAEKFNKLDDRIKGLEQAVLGTERSKPVEELVLNELTLGLEFPQISYFKDLMQTAEDVIESQAVGIVKAGKTKLENYVKSALLNKHCCAVLVDLGLVKDVEELECSCCVIQVDGARGCQLTLPEYKMITVGGCNARSYPKASGAAYIGTNTGDYNILQKDSFLRFLRDYGTAIKAEQRAYERLAEIIANCDAVGK